MKFFHLLILIFWFQMTEASNSNLFYIEIQEDTHLIGNIQVTAKDFVKQQQSWNWEDLFKVITSKTTEKKPKILFYTHGMWENKPKHFRTNVQYFQKYYINNENSKIGAVVIITWKADAFTYEKTKKNAKKSIPQMNAVLGKIAIQKTKHPNLSINMLCHSLGNFVFLNALDSVSNPIYDRLVLSSPDVPRPNKENLDQYQTMSKMADSITVLVNRKDRALLYSGKSNGENRLGRIGFETLPFDNFKQIETTSNQGTFGGYARISRHTHYRSNRETIQFLVNLLNN